MNTKQVIRCRITVTLRRPQIQQYTASNDDGVTKPTGHHIILTKYEAVNPVAVSEIFPHQGCF